jgi:hypothetical protein
MMLQIRGATCSRRRPARQGATKGATDVANPGGNPASLVPQRGNTHNARHGAYSPRLREGKARAVADAIMDAPHTVDLDEYGALEIGRLVALCDALDVALGQRGVTDAQGRVSDLVDARLRASRRLAEWLDRYGMTPKGRAEWARQLAEGGLAAEIARRRAAGNAGQAEAP